MLSVSLCRAGLLVVLVLAVLSPSVSGATIPGELGGVWVAVSQYDHVAGRPHHEGPELPAVSGPALHLGPGGLRQHCGHLLRICRETKVRSPPHQPLILVFCRFGKRFDPLQLQHYRPEVDYDW